MRPIGYYVHHHGAGHLHRALAIAGAMEGPITLLGSALPRGGALDLVHFDDDRMAGGGAFDGEDRAASRPTSLHYAPLDHAGIRQRTAAIARWIDATSPALIVVDVSVEIALLARLCSVPVVFVRLNGARVDPPHVEAFRSAEAILAPFHADLDEPDLPDWVREKTCHFPGLTSTTRPKRDGGDEILFLLGGNFGGTAERFCAIADANPGLRFGIAGGMAVPADCPANLVFHGWIDGPSAAIAASACVVGAAGDGLVSDVFAQSAPFICIPEDRPFDEQRRKADRLAAVDAAIVCEGWPAAGQWPALIEQAQAQIARRPSHLHDSAGPQKAASWLRSIADRWAA